MTRARRITLKPVTFYKHLPEDKKPKVRAALDRMIELRRGQISLLMEMAQFYKDDIKRVEDVKRSRLPLELLKRRR